MSMSTTYPWIPPILRGTHLALPGDLTLVDIDWEPSHALVTLETNNYEQLSTTRTADIRPTCQAAR